MQKQNRALGVLTAILTASSIAAAQTAPASGKCADAAPFEIKAKSSLATENKPLIELGQVYLCNGRFRDAQIALEDAVRREFKNFDAHFYLGRSMFEQGDYEAALAEYKLLGTLYTDHFEPFYQQGVVYARIRKPDESIQAFLKATEISKRINAPTPSIVVTYLALVSQYRAKKDFEGVARMYGLALELQPNDTTLMLARAQALFSANKSNDALPIAFEIRTKEPTNVAVVLLIADIYESQGFPDRALREIDNNLAINKISNERSDLYNKRGTILQKIGRATEAKPAYVAAVDANPNSWDAQYNLGVLLLTSKPADALYHFKNAARIRPNDGETVFGIAAAQDALKNYSAAYGTAKIAISLLSTPNQKNRARFLAGRTAYRSGQFQQAKAELLTLVATEPDNYDYQLWYGLTLYNLKDNAGSISALEAAVKLQPTEVEALASLGSAYFNAKRFGDAENAFRVVLKADTKNVTALTNLGLTLANLNRNQEACTTLTRAARLGSSPALKAVKQLKCK